MPKIIYLSRVSPVAIFLCVFAMTILASFDANAYCSEPSFFQNPPINGASYSKPSAPYCMSNYKYSGTHTCEDYQINAYVNEIDAYVESLRRFAQEANRFAEEAITFANNAVDFANCEIEDAYREIE